MRLQEAIKNIPYRGMGMGGEMATEVHCDACGIFSRLGGKAQIVIFGCIREKVNGRK